MAMGNKAQAPKVSGAGRSGRRPRAHPGKEGPAEPIEQATRGLSGLWVCGMGLSRQGAREGGLSRRHACGQRTSRRGACGNSATGLGARGGGVVLAQAVHSRQVSARKKSGR